MAEMSPWSSAGRLTGLIFVMAVKASRYLTHVRRLRVPTDALLHGRRNRYGVELDDREARVRDEHLLVGQPLDLELPEDVANEGEAHDVVAGPAGERDLIDALVARSNLAGDATGNGGGGNADAGER